MSNQAVETLQPLPEAPVQIDIPNDDDPKVHVDEDGKITEALTGEPPPPEHVEPPKPRKRANGRVGNALNRAIAAENHAAELQRQLEQANREAGELRQRSSQAEVGTFNAIEAQKKSELEKAESDYIQARTANDPAAEAAALKRMSSATQSLNDVEAWKATRQPEPEPQQRPQPQTQTQQQRQLPPPPPDPTTNAYLQENRWFLPYDFDQNGAPVTDQNGQLIQNPDYDGSMHDEATLLHKKLERLHQSGRFPHPPGSVGYFEEIASHMRSEFPDYFGDEEDPQPIQRTPPMQQSRQPVAPASRSGMPGQNNGTRKSADKPTLTREQAEFALSLRNAKSPGYVYGRGHPKAGEPMSDNDAMYKHWQEVKKDEPNTVTR